MGVVVAAAATATGRPLLSLPLPGLLGPRPRKAHNLHIEAERGGGRDLGWVAAHPIAVVPLDRQDGALPCLHGGDPAVPPLDYRTGAEQEGEGTALSSRTIEHRALRTVESPCVVDSCPASTLAHCVAANARTVANHHLHFQHAAAAARDIDGADLRVRGIPRGKHWPILARCPRARGHLARREQLGPHVSEQLSEVVLACALFARTPECICLLETY
mmetsp:Transcript_25770/g.53281  ORF Transcript_25770/g.53281 Transcript_25770/m.53281 type:complete len:217 (-) Transcript_25770:1645-2295(-)